MKLHENIMDDPDSLSLFKVNLNHLLCFLKVNLDHPLCLWRVSCMPSLIRGLNVWDMTNCL